MYVSTYTYGIRLQGSSVASLDVILKKLGVRWRLLLAICLISKVVVSQLVSIGRACTWSAKYSAQNSARNKNSRYSVITIDTSWLKTTLLIRQMASSSRQRIPSFLSITSSEATLLPESVDATGINEYLEFVEGYCSPSVWLVMLLWVNWYQLTEHEREEDKNLQLQCSFE